MAPSNALAQHFLQVGLLVKPTEIKIRSGCSSQFARWTDSNHSVIVQLTVHSYQYVRLPQLLQQCGSTAVRVMDEIRNLVAYCCLVT